MSENELPAPELISEEVIEEPYDDRSYTMTAGVMSYLAAGAQLALWMILLVAATYVDWTFLKLSDDHMVLSYIIYGFVVLLLLIYARFLTIQFRRLDDFVSITPKGIVALTHHTLGGFLWQKGRVENYTWTEIDHMYIDKINFRGVGSVIVLKNEADKRIGRIDLTYLSFSRKRLAKAIQENSGRDLLGG